MEDISGALTETPDGTIIAIEVSAGSKTELFPSGYNPWRKTAGCMVSAQPVGGKANMAVIGLIASMLGISRNEVRILAGASSSQKKVMVQGLSAEEVKRRL